MTANDLVNQGYRKYIGWNDTEANADFKATGGGERAGATGAPSAPSADDIVNTAKKLNDFQIQANQPAITQLQGQQAPLEQRYKDLVANIKGQQDVATNRQTLTTNNELGRRGISSDSGLYQQDMTNSLNPIGVQYGGLLNQADTAHSGDVNTLANQIASLQSGNPATSISGGFQLGGLQQNAQSLAQALAAQNAQLPLIQAQTGYQNALAQALSGSSISALDAARMKAGG